jgi:hypothetical protein
LLPREAIRHISTHVPCRSPSISFVAQLTNHRLHGFEAQTKKLSR